MGKKINYDDTQLTTLPTRLDFINKQINQQINTDIINNQPLYFLPIDIVDQDDDFKGNWKYVIYCFGIMPDGSKTCFIINDAPVFFDVRVPDDKNPNQFKSLLRDILMRKKLNYKGMSDIKGFPLNKFYLEEKNYIRCFFATLKDRKSALAVVNTLFETASNDDGSFGSNYYFIKLARENKYNTNSWNKIEKYENMHNSKFSKTNCEYEFVISYENIKGMNEDEMKLVNDNFNKQDTILNPLVKDYTIIMTWDIETYSFDKQTVPTKESTDFIIFNICCTFHYQFSTEPILRIGIVDVDSNLPQNADYLIICKTRENVLKSFIEVIGRMKPDIMMGFNNGNFDTPLFREECFRHIKDDLGVNCGLMFMKQHLSSLKSTHDLKLLEKIDECKRKAILSKNQSDIQAYAEEIHNLERGYDNSGGIYKWNFIESEKIKINAEKDMYSTIMKFPGIIDVDIMIVFMQLYPTMEVNRKHSLNFFLGKNGLPSKEDMPYKKMFQIYEEASKQPSEKTAENMTDVVSYCITDAFRCQQLCVKRTIIDDRRELANMSYVTLYDSFYRANGMKVRNLIGSMARDPKFNIMFSNGRVNNPRKKFPGAWVFPPKRGVNRRRPVTGLDFSSLYPSLMMTYNLSPDKSIEDPEEANRLISEGYSLHRIEFKLDDTDIITGWTVKHNNVINEGDKVIRGYENINNKLIPNISDRQHLRGERMGLFPYILKWLFDFRAKLKKSLIKLSLLNEKIIKIKNCTDINEIIQITDDDLISTEYAGKLNLFDQTLLMEKNHISKLIDEITFWKNKVDSKQKAVKIFMNTFYGEMGNSNSAIYKLLIAGAITNAGQYNIKMVANFMENLGYTIWYGDTDSVYGSSPEDIFKQADEKYSTNNNIIEYWTEMVKLTQISFDKLRTTVNNMLATNNGTLFLNMAYEEVLFPVVFTGKKKYFGFQHLKTINFYPDDKDIFIRGLEIIKQGQSQLAKTIGMEILRECCSPSCTESLDEIIKNKIKKIYTEKWDLTNFIINAKYKLPKEGKPGNIQILTFIKRMKEMRKKYEDRNDLKMTSLYEIPEVGDTFQYVVTKNTNPFDIKGRKANPSVGNKMELVNVYVALNYEIDLDYYIDGSILGFMARLISDKFEDMSIDDYKKRDDDSVKGGKKYLESFRDNLVGKDKIVMNEIGKKYKSIYKNVQKGFREHLLKKLNNSNCVDILINLDTNEVDVLSQLIEFANQVAKCDEEFCRRIVDDLDTNDDIFSIRRWLTFKGEICDMKAQHLKLKIEDTKNSLIKVLPNIIKLVGTYNSNIEFIITDLRINTTNLFIYDSMTEDEIKIIKDFYHIWEDLAIFIKLLKQNQYIKEYIEKLVEKRIACNNYNNLNTNDLSRIIGNAKFDKLDEYKF